MPNMFSIEFPKETISQARGRNGYFTPVRCGASFGNEA